MAARKRGGKFVKRPAGAAISRWSDHLTHQAKAENYPARSVYKLEEIHKKFNILRKRMLTWVVPLGHRHGCCTHPDRWGLKGSFWR